MHIVSDLSIIYPFFDPADRHPMHQDSVLTQSQPKPWLLLTHSVLYLQNSRDLQIGASYTMNRSSFAYNPPDSQRLPG